MRYGSICSGIEAATMAWHHLGWEPAFFSEIDRFPRAVLKHHYPDVPLHGDFTTIEADQYGAIDLLVGGTPCQSFSIAGLRAGLDDDRGNLALEFLRLADRKRPRWLVWENVPGVLSSNGGRDFGAILGGMVELGYGFAYRVLDAQYVRTRLFPWAVPQRRRRVFVVGYLGDWRRAAAVLFEPESLRRDPPPRREAGQVVAPTISARSTGGGGLGTDFDCDGGVITSHDPATTLTAREFKGALPEADLSTVVAHSLRAQSQSVHASDLETYVAHSLKAEGFDASEDGTGRGTPLVPVHEPITLAERGRKNGQSLETRQDGSSNAILTPSGGRGGLGIGAVAFAENSRAEVRLQGGDGQVAPQLTTGGGKPGQGQPCIADPWAVRRLTPRECERLQGFPDDFTLIPYRGKPADKCPDGPRYKALGNSMAVNVMQHIGQRIALVDQIGGL